MVADWDQLREVSDFIALYSVNKVAKGVLWKQESFTADLQSFYKEDVS